MNAALLLLVEVTVIWTLALLAVGLAAKARASVRHLILKYAFAVVLVLPLATVVSPRIVLEIPVLPAEPVGAISAIAAPFEVAPQRPEASPAERVPVESPAPAEPLPATTWLLLVWATAALIALVPVVASLSHLRSIRRHGHPWPEGAARINDLAQTAGIRPPAVLLHEGIAGPITSGILHPVIVLPSSAVKWSGTHIVNALVHELEHVRRRDWPVHLAARAVCALYWFHPLSWIAWRVLRLEAERACDDAVLAREDAATYADQLLGLARHLAHKPALAGLSMASSSDLSTRIKSVLDNMRARGRAGVVVIACTAFVAVVAVAALAPLRATATEEKRLHRGAELLAQRADADAQAAGALMIADLGQHEQPLAMVAQASLLAPERADLVWLHIQLCEAVASCDPEPLERRLQVLDEKNGAGWLGALARASKRGDEAAKSAALAAVARSGRVDVYWTTLVARLTPQVASTKALSLPEAMKNIIGGLAAVAIPRFRDITDDACKAERATQENVMETCRGVANSLLNGDTIKWRHHHH
jgi:beta-lactamase regulating signal transducer with metallopeptidase domain